MKALVKVMVSFVAFGLATSSFASSVPEIFGQPEQGQIRVQLDGEYSMAEFEPVANMGTVESTDIKPSLWFDYGLTHNIGMRVGTSVSIYEVTLAGSEFSDEAFNNMKFELFGHNNFSMITLFYGVDAGITLDKEDTGGDKDLFTNDHQFRPYLGVAGSFGPATVGVRGVYNYVSSNNGMSWKNNILNEVSYTAGIFAEMMATEAVLLGLSVDYNTGASATGLATNDVVTANLGPVPTNVDNIVPRLYGVVGIADGLSGVFGASYAFNVDSDYEDYTDMRFKLGVRYSY